MDKLEQLKSLLQQSPNDPFLLYAIALEQVKAGNETAALENFLKLVKEHPSYIATYYQLGKFYEERNEKEKALDTFQQGMNLTLGKDQKTFSELQNAYQNLSLNLEE